MEKTSSEFKCLFDAVIVKPIEAEEYQGNLIHVPDMGKELNPVGEVVEVGKGRYLSSGQFVKTEVKKGQKVILPTQGFTRMVYQNEEYFIGPENQILAIIK